MMAGDAKLSLVWLNSNDNGVCIKRLDGSTPDVTIASSYNNFGILPALSSRHKGFIGV